MEWSSFFHEKDLLSLYEIREPWMSIYFDIYFVKEKVEFCIFLLFCCLSGKYYRNEEEPLNISKSNFGSLVSHFNRNRARTFLYVFFLVPSQNVGGSKTTSPFWKYRPREFRSASSFSKTLRTTTKSNVSFHDVTDTARWVAHWRGV